MDRYGKYAVCVMLVVCGLLAWSCDGGGSKSKLVLSPAPELRVSDVPVPKGFSFQVKKSQDSVGGAVRRVVHVYKGRGDLTQVAEFYRTQLPSYGWKLDNVTFDRGIYRFNASKGMENCVVSAWRSVWTTKLMIQIFPRSVKK